MESNEKKSKNSKKSQMTKDHIHNCAMELFSEFGYDNVTIMQICEKAGITKRTFYYHFTSKDDILTSVTEYVGLHTKDLVDTFVEQTTNVGMLWTLMSAYSINAEKQGASIINRLYITKLQGKEKAIFPDEMYLYKTAIRTIRNAQLEKEIPSTVPAENLAYTLFHAFRSISFTWAAGNSLGDLKENYRVAFNSVLGLSPEEGI